MKLKDKVQTIATYLPGIALASLVAIVSKCLIFLFNWNFPEMTLSILLGMVIGNIIPISSKMQRGVLFSLRNLLRIAIILLGFRINFYDIANIGMNGILLDILIVSSTFVFTVWIGEKIFKIDTRLLYLIASGSSICGASAILATASIVKSSHHHNSIAIGLVTVYGTISMLLYPLLYKIGYLYGLDTISFGIFLGGSIHEIGQVISAGFSISSETGNTAVIIKLARVMLLAPLLLFLSYFILKKNPIENSVNEKIQIPWFVLFFIATSGINSIPNFPIAVRQIFADSSINLMLVSMAALGIETNWKMVKNVGIKPFYLGAAVFIFLFFTTWLLTYLLYPRIS